MTQAPSGILVPIEAFDADYVVTMETLSRDAVQRLCTRKNISSPATAQGHTASTFYRDEDMLDYPTRTRRSSRFPLKFKSILPGGYSSLPL